MSELSIIIPSYNQSRYIKQALDSVIAQEVSDWECIVVDDGSNDDSVRIIKDYAMLDRRIKPIFQENQGVSAARNRGLQAVSGSYVLFLDADDYIAPHLSTILIGVLKENPVVSVVFGCSESVDHSGKELGRISKLPPQMDNYVFQLLLANLFQLNCAVVRAEAILPRGIAFREDLRPEDWAFWLEMSLSGAKFMAVDHVVAYYRKHGEARSTQIRRKTEAAERLLDTMFSKAEHQLNVPAYLKRLSLAALYARAYRESFFLGNDEALNYCRHQVKLVLSPALIGVSRFHFEILGRYLDVTEDTGLFPLLYPLVWLRLLKRSASRWLVSNL